MTLIFQIAAVAVVVLIAFFILRGGGARHQAVRRILLLLFVLGAALSLFFPQMLTWIAKFVGIGRGTDLLLYVLVLAFLGYAATSYRRFRHLETDITELARQLALVEAGPPPGSDAPARRPAEARAASKAPAAKPKPAKPPGA
jgi:hypothetical protein